MRVNGLARRIWNRLSTSLWFVPATMVLGSAVLALVLIEADRGFDRSELTDSLPWLFRGGADSARGLLATIASSAITVMGVIFSITVVALTLASTQFTPRVLRNFMRDRGNQTVLGIFTSTFTYALLVMRSVRSVEEGSFVPTLAVTTALLLALVSVGAVIFFINHIAESIQVANIVGTVMERTGPLIERLFPDRVGHAFVGTVPPGESAPPVPALGSGYVRFIDGDALIELAREHASVIHLEVGIGDYVLEGAPLARVDSARDPLQLAKSIASTVELGHERSLQQDAEFGIRQIMDIAVKALSPGINDPTTAITCVDHLSTLVRIAALRDDPAPARADAEGKLRLVARGQTFTSIAAHAVNQIRQHAARDVAVTLRLLKLLENVGRVTQDDERRQFLWRQACMIAQGADRSIPSPIDREAVNEMLRTAAAALGRDPGEILLDPAGKEST